MVRQHCLPDTEYDVQATGWHAHTDPDDTHISPALGQVCPLHVDCGIDGVAVPSLPHAAPPSGLHAHVDPDGKHTVPKVQECPPQAAKFVSPLHPTPSGSGGFCGSLLSGGSSPNGPLYVGGSCHVYS